MERLHTVQERSGGNEEQITRIWDVIAEDMRLQTQDAQNRMIRVSEQMEAHRNRKRPLK